MYLKNFKNRPFLAVKYFIRPGEGQKTEMKNFKEHAVWDVMEIPNIHFSLSNKILIESHVIIDIVNNKVLKNRFDEESNEDVLSHFFAKYEDDIIRTVARWQGKTVEEITKPYIPIVDPDETNSQAVEISKESTIAG